MNHCSMVAVQSIFVSSWVFGDRRIWEATRIRDVFETLSVTMRDGEETTSEIKIAGGSKDRTIERHASPLLDGRGKPAGAVVVLHDVSELRRLETVRREFIGQPERVKEIFLSTATDLKRERYFQGAGLVDMMRAIQSV